MLWLIPAIAAAAAILLAGIGAVIVAGANSSLQDGIARVRAPRTWMDAARLSAALDRLRADGEGIAAVLGRCATAVRNVRAGLVELRLPEAVAALRLAALAVRALTHAR